MRGREGRQAVAVVVGIGRECVSSRVAGRWQPLHVGIHATHSLFSPVSGE